jgi:hypothetical protein
VRLLDGVQRGGSRFGDGLVVGNMLFKPASTKMSIFDATSMPRALASQLALHLRLRACTRSTRSIPYSSMCAATRLRISAGFR